MSVTLPCPQHQKQSIYSIECIQNALEFIKVNAADPDFRELFTKSAEKFGMTAVQQRKNSGRDSDSVRDYYNVYRQLGLVRLPYMDNQYGLTEIGERFLRETDHNAKMAILATQIFSIEFPNAYNLESISGCISEGIRFRPALLLLRVLSILPGEQRFINVQDAKRLLFNANDHDQMTAKGVADTIVRVRNSGDSYPPCEDRTDNRQASDWLKLFGWPPGFQFRDGALHTSLSLDQLQGLVDALTDSPMWSPNPSN